MADEAAGTGSLEGIVGSLARLHVMCEGMRSERERHRAGVHSALRALSPALHSQREHRALLAQLAGGVPAQEADEALREGRFTGETADCNAVRGLLSALCGGRDRAFPEGEGEVAAWRGALDERVDRLWEEADEEDREALRRLLEKVK